MIYPSGDELEKRVGSKYALVMAVAKRAKQLREGAPRLVESKSRNPITVALEEIAAGKVKVVIPTQEELEAAERQEGVPKPGPVEAADLLRIPEQEAALESPAELEQQETPTAASDTGAELAEEQASESEASARAEETEAAPELSAEPEEQEAPEAETTSMLQEEAPISAENIPLETKKIEE